MSADDDLKQLHLEVKHLKLLVLFWWNEFALNLSISQQEAGHYAAELITRPFASTFFIFEKILILF